MSPSDDELPPLDEGDEGDGVAGDAEPLPLEEDDESLDEFDDERPTDPDFDFDLPSELDASEADTPHELPLGPAFAPNEDDDAAATASDAFGFAGSLDPSDGLVEGDENEPHDAADGPAGGMAELDEAELPVLDGDDGPDFDAPSFGAQLESAHEGQIPEAERPFRVDFLAPAREHCSALAAERGVVLAGSSDLFWLDAGSDTLVRTGLDGTRITSLALLGHDGKTALAVTAFGRLLRRARSSSDVERLVEWRRVAEASGATAERLDLRGLGPNRPTSVLGRLASGRLTRSDDLGTTFEMLDAGITALALSLSGDPVAVITRDGGHLALSMDAGSTWTRLELASPAREVASGEAPLVAANGNVVVLGDIERGAVVSADRGRTFCRVPGVTNVTAVTTGRAGAESSAFVAVYRETDDRSLLVEVDAQTGAAVTIAVIALPVSGDPDAALELGRVERLLWDGGRLWAAGGFGLALVRPPS
jgi:hypothetical protein